MIIPCSTSYSRGSSLFACLCLPYLKRPSCHGFVAGGVLAMKRVVKSESVRRVGRTEAADGRYATYVGRVGALAVALGVGVATTVGCGAAIAVADDGDSAESAMPSTDSPSAQTDSSGDSSSNEGKSFNTDEAASNSEQQEDPGGDEATKDEASKDLDEATVDESGAAGGPSPGLRIQYKMMVRRPPQRNVLLSALLTMMPGWRPSLQTRQSL